MPRVKVYDENVVPLARTTGARFADVPNSGSGFGAGLQQLGQALGEHAKVATEIEKQEGAEEAKRLDVQYLTKAAELRQRVRSARGVEADAALSSATAELQQFQKDLIGSATNHYAKRELPDIFNRRFLQEQDSWAEHALGQKRVAEEAASNARADTSLDTALDFDVGSQAAEDNLTTGLGEIASANSYLGSEVVAQKQAAYRSRYHSGRINQLYSSEQPEAAQAYIDTHRGEMSAEDEAQARAMIRGELLANRDEADGALILSGGAAPPSKEGHPAPPPGESKWHPPIRQHTVTVKGGEPGAPRPYGGHSGRDYAGVKPGTPVYPMAEGVVDKVYRSKGGGNTIEIKYADGSRSTYKHLADGSTAGLKPGETVGPDDTVGAVGNTGTASHGAHLHAELVTRDGRRVDPAKMANQAAPAAPPPDGRRVDLAQMYQRIDAQPWSESRKRRAKDWAQRYAGENDQVLARSQQDAERAITQRILEIEQGGGKLTKTNQLPPEAIKGASPSFMLQIQNTIAANNKPQAVEANGDVALALKIQAARDPEGFKGANLVPLRPFMTPGEFADLAVDQAKLRGAPAQASPLANLRSEIDTTISFYGKEIGLDINDRSSDGDRKTYGRISDTMRAYLQRVTGGKRAPTDDEMKAAFDAATMQVTVRNGGMFGGTSTKRAYDIDPNKPEPVASVSIPTDVATRIRSAFAAAYHRLPNNDELAREYLRNRGRPGFWQ